MHLVGYLYEDYHDARSLERKVQFLHHLVTKIHFRRGHKVRRMTECLCVRMGQIGSRWTDFCDILYWRRERYLLKYAEKIHIWIQSD
jgi:hypothetical protein